MTDDTTKPDPKRAAMLAMGQDAKPAPKAPPTVPKAPEPKTETPDVEEA